MLIAEGPALAPARAQERPIRPAIATSLTAHALLLLGLVLPEAGRVPPNVPPLEIEMIPIAAMTPGEPATRAQPQPQTAASPPSPALPQSEPAAPASAPSSPTSPPPNVNIGNGPERSDPLQVTGENIVPPAPDSRFRNLPPPYPAEAARVGAEGTVQLMIHVSPQGLPFGVEVVHSSGNQSLDGAARRAVERWRFRPARDGDRAVAFDYLLNIRFALGDHP